jgi:hypothetical protein
MSLFLALVCRCGAGRRAPERARRDRARSGAAKEQQRQCGQQSHGAHYTRHMVNGKGRMTEPSAHAVAAHRASYPDPIRLRRGDPVRLTGRKDVWEGALWLWAVGPDGREGWIPADLVDRAAPAPQALEDYSAMELTVAQGERVAALRRRGGWVWARRADGAEGGIPGRCLP